jgi:2-polyprenyl-3-methyl-5-hydroxy-6-metoxy-1,4-benzoquinol methylase
VRIEEFTDPAQFDHVVAILSLHHVEDLGTAVSNMADLLRAGGRWS